MKEKVSADENKIVSGGTGYMPDVVIKKPGKIVLYPVTRNELQVIKNSNYGNIAFNLFTCSISVAASLFIAFFTCKFDPEYTKLIFLYTAILFAILSIIAFIVWWRKRKRSNELYDEIINREDLT